MNTLHTRLRDPETVTRPSVYAMVSHDNVAAAAYIQCRHMATTTQIAKWGKSLGVRLPRAVALEARVGEGDAVDVFVRNGAIVICPTRRTYSSEELVGGITARNRHTEADWGMPVGDEVW